MKYLLTPTAETDLEQIWNRIAPHSLRAADALEGELFEAFDLLGEFPRLGLFVLTGRMKPYDSCRFGTTLSSIASKIRSRYFAFSMAPEAFPKFCGDSATPQA